MRGINFMAAALVAISATALFAQESEIGTERRAIARIVPMNAVMAGAKLGMTKIEDLGDPVVSFGVFGDTAVQDNVLVGGSFDYWEKSTGTLTQNRLNVNDMILGVNGRYLFSQIIPPLKPYVGVGASAHRINSKSSVTTNNVIERTQKINNKISLDLGGGVMYRLQERVNLEGEARYKNILGGTAYDQMAFTGGVSYMM